MQNERGMESYDSAVILAAGKGIRMKSSITKLLHPLMGRPILEYVIDATSHFKNRVFVVRKGCDEICGLIGNRGKIAFQSDCLGTGDALLCAEPFIKGDFVVIPGDVPLVSKSTLRRLIKFHLKEGADATIACFETKEPKGYGRIIKLNGKVKIVEESDATPREREIGLVNSGIYCFDKRIFDLLKRLENKNKKGEYYLTDAISHIENVSLLEIDEKEAMGINTRYHLFLAEDILRKRILMDLMASGVTIKDINTTYIEQGVKIKQDTTIFPHTYILGKTQIGSFCTIGPFSWIKDTKIYDKSKVSFSYIEDSIIGGGCNIGPFSHIRPNSVIKEEAHIGAFVQVKKSTIGRQTKAGHLAYIGDASLGERVNIGAGVITCNFDGRKKYRTTIGDDAFIGSNTSLIAPIKIGKKAFIGAGSVITKDVPPEALSLERTEQKTIPKWRK